MNGCGSRFFSRQSRSKRRWPMNAGSSAGPGWKMPASTNCWTSSACTLASNCRYSSTTTSRSAASTPSKSGLPGTRSSTTAPRSSSQPWIFGTADAVRLEQPVERDLVLEREQLGVDPVRRAPRPGAALRPVRRRRTRSVASGSGAAPESTRAPSASPTEASTWSSEGMTVDVAVTPVLPTRAGRRCRPSSDRAPGGPPRCAVRARAPVRPGRPVRRTAPAARGGRSRRRTCSRPPRGTRWRGPARGSRTSIGRSAGAHTPENAASVSRHSANVRVANVASSSRMHASAFAARARRSVNRASVASSGRPITSQSSAQ